MPEPLKFLYNRELIRALCTELKSEYPTFDSRTFTRHVFDKGWGDRELKQRMRHIARCLHRHLPDDYLQALAILKPVSSRFSGFEYMFFQDYVELYGLEHYQPSITALEQFTKYSSSEFAVRQFIIRYPDRMMRQMERWAASKNHHVRRLASEGCRPRLPWAIALPAFKEDPQAVLRILNKLKDDDSEYVRRSVANNLNDISKDNPQQVIDTAKHWLGDNDDTDWIIRHACRSLLKQGDPEVLKLFGFAKPTHVKIDNLQAQKSVRIGSKLAFSFDISSSKKKLGKLRIEYAIDFMKQNGKLSRKVFKILEAVVDSRTKSVSKSHSFKLISTRKYYPGRHGIAIIVNGKELTNTAFTLRIGGRKSN